MDFSAGNDISHHLDYVITYAHFLRESGHEVIIAIPKYAPRDTPELNGFDVRRVLTSDIYSPSNIRYPLNLVFNFYMKYLQNYSSRLNTYIKLMVRKNHLKRAEKILLGILQKNEDAMLFFPSVDSLTIHFINLIVHKNFKIKKIFLRIISIEFKSNTRSGNEISMLNNFIRLKEKQIVVGCETKALGLFLQENCSNYQNVYWVPLPSIKRSISNKTNDKIIFGFLGGAKKRKGFEEIPKWIHEIDKQLLNTSYVVQETPYPWPGYNDVLTLLKSMKHVKLLPQVIGRQSFFKAIFDCSYVVLPYDKTSYNLTGSSVFFYAADMLIPVIASTGCGFSSEVVDYQCGLLSSDQYNDVKKLSLNEITRLKLLNGIRNYNTDRNKFNKLFLQI